MLVYLFGGKVEVRITKLMSQIYILAMWPIQRLLLAVNICHSYYSTIVVNEVWSKFDCVENGGIKHNQKNANMRQKQRKHFEVNMVLRFNCIFPASCNFFCTVMKDLSNLIHNNSHGDEDKECL